MSSNTHQDERVPGPRTRTEVQAVQDAIDAIDEHDIERYAAVAEGTNPTHDPVVYQKKLKVHIAVMRAWRELHRDIRRYLHNPNNSERMDYWADAPLMYDPSLRPCPCCGRDMPQDMIEYNEAGIPVDNDPYVLRGLQSLEAYQDQVQSAYRQLNADMGSGDVVETHDINLLPMVVYRRTTVLLRDALGDLGFRTPPETPSARGEMRGHADRPIEEDPTVRPANNEHGFDIKDPDTIDREADTE